MNPTGIFYIPARYHAVLYTGTERTSNMPLINSVVKVYRVQIQNLILFS